jgi:predicted glycoside hydrolase/deacetylase ChbG (UPF0249 family)
MRAVSGRLVAAEVEAEVSAQIARIRDAGVRVSHVDGHKHLHQLPVVAGAVVAGTAAIWHRARAPDQAAQSCGPGAAGRAVRELLALRAAGQFRRAGLRFPRRVADLQAIMSMASAAAVGSALQDANGIVELFCHPGTAQADIEKPGSCARHDELQFLLSARFREHHPATSAPPRYLLGSLKQCAS